MNDKKSYTYIFHMPGIEAWFWRMLDQIPHVPIGLVLDIGVGLGFWGFMVRSWANMRKVSEPYLIGIDINKVKLAIVKRFRMYDELVMADAYCLPLRKSSLDLVMAVEVFDCKRLAHAVQRLDVIADKDSTIFLSLPIEAGCMDNLTNNGYKMYGVFLRSLFLVDDDTGRITPFYKTTFSKAASVILTIAWRLFHRRIIKYVIAIKGP